MLAFGCMRSWAEYWAPQFSHSSPPEFHLALLDVAALVQVQEEGLRGVRVNGPRGPAVDVERDPQSAERLVIGRMVPVDHLLGRNALFERRQGNWHAVFVRPADIQHRMAAQALEPRIDVRRQIRPRDVAEMNVAVGIRQRAGNDGSCVLRFRIHGSSRSLPYSDWH